VLEIQFHSLKMPQTALKLTNKCRFYTVLNNLTWHWPSFHAKSDIQTYALHSVTNNNTGIPARNKWTIFKYSSKKQCRTSSIYMTLNFLSDSLLLSAKFQLHSHQHFHTGFLVTVERRLISSSVSVEKTVQCCTISQQINFYFKADAVC